MRISVESVVSHLGFTTVFILLAPPHSHEHVYILKTYQASEPHYQSKVAAVVGGNSLLHFDVIADCPIFALHRQKIASGKSMLHVISGAWKPHWWQCLPVS